jgi:hypothetical protein
LVHTRALKTPDELKLIDEHGAVLLTIPYSSQYPWPVAANATGHSMVLANPSYGEEDPRAWGISEIKGGSPGQAEFFSPSPLRNVVINEVLAHTESGALDFIELHNHSAVSNDLSGCILTDDPGAIKFVLPPGTVLPPHGFVSFDELQLGFALNAQGETVYLLTPNNSRVIDALQFEGQSDSISFGRWPDGAEVLYPLEGLTQGTNNAPPKISEVVVNELMYNPISKDDDDQFIELYNRGTATVDLTGWEFTAGVSYTFPNGTLLAPGGYLVIARNLTNLLAKYPNLNATNTLGNYSGKLAHGGERVALSRPELLNGTDTVYVVEDEVTYEKGGRWGRWAAGGGSSLELIDPRANHRLASNWADSDDTAKSTWTTIEHTGVLDQGRNFSGGILNAQLGPLDEGECLIDNVEVINAASGTNCVKNPGFEAGLNNWSLQGCMVRSALCRQGGSAGRALHVRCSSRIWTGANSCQASLFPSGLSMGRVATLRFKARWLHGWPEVLLRLNGNWLEAVGKMDVPLNLGTPGAPNSRALANNGPAIYDVAHNPPVPTYWEPTIVTAKVHDPDGVLSVTLNWRMDGDTTYTNSPMTDDGLGGDAVAHDGIFTATLPSTYGIVAFYVSARDSRGVSSRFPQLLNDNAPVRECVVLLGPDNPGGSFATYNLWISRTNVERWSELPNLSNEMHDGTFVCGKRIIYNMQGRFVGSPYHQQFWSPESSPCHYKWVFPDDDKFLGATSFNKIHAPGNGPGDDSSIQREQLAYTFMRTLGVPWLNRRYVVVRVNGNRILPLMEDTQCPDADMVDEYFPNDTEGYLYKMQPWFEFSPNITGTYLDYQNVSWCFLLP